MLAGDGAPEGTVIVADYQTAGRGRRGRAWTAPPGSALLFSVLLRPPFPPARWPELSLAGACAVAEGVWAATGLTPRVKWPNDVLVGDRKVAGVLAEGIVGVAAHVVLGVGINVLGGAELWPPALAERAASLAALGYRGQRQPVLTAVLGRLAARYADLCERGFAPVREACRRWGTFGVPVAAGGHEGVAIDLGPDGELLLRHADGRTHAIRAGEIDIIHTPTADNP
jgi:BirA family transcriptional regulator, biotin operon repressor / biotin---[acetyl-CoA-carboxylase] ligase